MTSACVCRTSEKCKLLVLQDKHNILLIFVPCSANKEVLALRGYFAPPIAMRLKNKNSLER